MKTQIYHQLGYRDKWNLQSIKDDNSGDGIIIAPRYMDKTYVEGLDEETKNSAIFDPQFFLPGVPRGSLSTYDFFPDVTAGGFSTNVFSKEHAQGCANNCVKFQIENNLSLHCNSYPIHNRNAI